MSFWTTFLDLIQKIPSIHMIVQLVVTFHHSMLGRYFEQWAVQQITDALPDGCPAEKLVEQLYEDAKSL
jgi:hypothetical protein